MTKDKIIEILRKHETTFNHLVIIPITDYKSIADEILAELSGVKDCTKCPSNQFYLANTAKIMDIEELNSEVKESVTDEEIISYIQSRCRYHGGNISLESFGIEIVTWLRSRLQPAQSPLTDEQIDDWAEHYVYGNFLSSQNDDSIMRLRYNSIIEGAKAYRDGLIAEWLKK